MNVCIVGGTGYVGLITGLGLAEIGHQVTGVDIDRARVEMLQAGRLPVVDPGLDAVLRRNLGAGRIEFTTDLAAGVRHSGVVYITVATPASSNGEADLSHVVHAARDLRHHLRGYTVVVVKSTVPIGTIDLIVEILRATRREGVDFDVVVNPEFLREGEGLSNFLRPDRVVIGTDSERASSVMRELYRPIILRQVSWQPGRHAGSGDPVPLIETDPASALMIKYASNAFLAARIALVNEVAWLCERVGANISDVTRGMGYDPRIGPRYLQPGLGFGGPCLEKDLRALMTHADGESEAGSVLASVLAHNEWQVARVVAKVHALVGAPLSGRRLAVLGLVFKAGTNDVRNSLALRVAERLQREGAVVWAYDPAVLPGVPRLHPHIAYQDDPYEAVRDAVALVVLADWPQFRTLDFRRIHRLMAQPNIVDGRNLLDGEAMRRLGFVYAGIGTGAFPAAVHRDARAVRIPPAAG